MTRTTTGIRTALLLTLLFAAGCRLHEARELAIRIAATTLRHSVFCLQGSVPLTQSSFKRSPFAANRLAVAPQPDGLAADTLAERAAALRTVTCPIARRSLLAGLVLRTL
jgi:hypothetical protein